MSNNKRKLFFEDNLTKWRGSQVIEALAPADEIFATHYVLRRLELGRYVDL